MLDLGRNCLDRTGLQDVIEFRLRLCHEAKTTFVNDDSTPRPGGDPMRTREADGHGVLVPLFARANQVQPLGKFGTIAQRTLKRQTDPGATSIGVQHPLTGLERRSMTDVLAVTT